MYVILVPELKYMSRQKGNVNKKYEETSFMIKAVTFIHFEHKHFNLQVAYLLFMFIMTD